MPKATEPKPFKLAADEPVKVEAVLSRMQRQRVEVDLPQGATWDDYQAAVKAACKEDDWVTSAPQIVHHVLDGPERRLPKAAYGRSETVEQPSPETLHRRRCPRCDSPSPELHPAVQSEGEVQTCPDPWHDAKAAEG